MAAAKPILRVTKEEHIVMLLMLQVQYLKFCLLVRMVKFTTSQMKNRWHLLLKLQKCVQKLQGQQWYLICQTR